MPAPRIRIVGSDDIAMAVSSGSGSGLSCWRFLFFLFCSISRSLGSGVWFLMVGSVAFLVRSDGEVIAKTFLISKTSHCSCTDANEAGQAPLLTISSRRDSRAGIRKPRFPV